MKSKINIYLNKEDRKKVDALKVKYQLSLTTIIDILMLETISIFNKAENNEALLNRLFYDYMYNKGQKTSITLPRETCEQGILKEIKNKSRLATNVIKIYIEHDIKNYINDAKLIEKYYNECNTKLNKAIDNWWNYNQHLRYQRRMLRENKEYFRKALEQ